MVKNSEWGAVAYLSKSKYGANETKVAQNTDSSYYTGGTDTLSTIYTENAGQSTTLNAYGVYDMSGGSWEYVASYVNNGNSNLSSYGGEMTTSDVIAASTKYKTVYASTTTSGSDTQSADYNLAASVKGDAVYETSGSYSSNTGSWQSAYAKFPYGAVRSSYVVAITVVATQACSV